MGLVNVDIDLLRTLVVLAEVRNFTQAGERLLRTQSAISLQIKKLEGIVGQTVFARGNGREIALTRTGEVVRQYALEILRLNDDLLREITSADQTVLKIGMPDDYAQLLLPQILPRFVERNGGIEIQIMSDLSINLAKMVDRKLLDLAFITRPSDGDGIRVIQEPLVWVASPQSRAGFEPTLPLAIFPEGCQVRELAIETLTRAGRNWRVAYCSNQFAPLREPIVSGTAIGILPLHAVPNELVDIGSSCGLPTLPEVELVLKICEDAPPSVNELATDIISAFHHQVKPHLPSMSISNRRDAPNSFPLL